MTDGPLPKVDVDEVGSLASQTEPERRQRRHPRERLGPRGVGRAGTRCGRFARRLPPRLVAAHPRRGKRCDPDHHRPHRHLRLLRGEIERILQLGEHRQPVRPGGLHHSPGHGRALCTHSQRDRPVGRLRGCGGCRHRARPDGVTRRLALVGGPHRGPGRLLRHRRLPGHIDHPAQDPLFRGDAGRVAGLAGRLDLRLRRRQRRGRRRDQCHERRARRPRERQHDPDRGLDPAYRGRGSLCPDLHPQHRPAAFAGPERAPVGHHVGDGRGRRRGGHRARLHLQPEPGHR